MEQETDNIIEEEVEETVVRKKPGRKASTICGHERCRKPKHGKSGYCRKHKNEYQRNYQKKKEENLLLNTEYLQRMERLKSRNPNLYKALIEGDWRIDGEALGRKAGEV